MSALSDRALALIDFFTTEVGRPAHVFHDPSEAVVHVDVHVIPPAPDRPRYTLFTTGMSDQPLPGAPGCGCHPDRVELVMALPESWPLSAACPCCEPDAEVEPGRHWPIMLMRELALYPHESGKYFGRWHTMTYLKGVGDTRFGGVVLAPPKLGPFSFGDRLGFGDEQISVLAPVLLHARELKLARRRGTDVILGRLDAAGVTELVDESRPDLAKRSRRRPRRGRAN